MSDFIIYYLDKEIDNGQRMDQIYSLTIIDQITHNRPTIT